MTPDITRPLRYNRIQFEQDGIIVAPSVPNNILTLCFPEKMYKGADVIVEDTLDSENGILTTGARLHTAQKYKVESTNLATMLLTKWSTDAHYVQYYTPLKYRLRKTEQDTLPQEVEFHFVAFDLDFQDHGRPTPQHYRHLKTVLAAFDFIPNLVYATRGGARIIYYIEPIYDAALFEKHYRAFLGHPSKGLHLLNNGQHQHGYHVDLKCKDWTRMFRAPHVVRDGEPTYDMPVDEFYCMVGKRLDLLGFKVKEKKRTRRVLNNADFDQNDGYLIARYDEIKSGSRNDSLFRACCHIFRSYNQDGIDRWLNVFVERAENEGLVESEIQQVISSAQKTVGGR